MIERKFYNGVWLYDKDDAVLKHDLSLRMLILGNAQDFTDNEYKQVLNYIKEEIEASKTLRRKLDYYSLFNEMYYRASSSNIGFKSDWTITYSREACIAIQEFIKRELCGGI